MKKILCLTALLFAGFQAFAVDVELGGQHRARAIYDGGQDISDVFVQRFKLDGSFRPNEMFESRFWLLTNYKWGDQEYLDNEVRFYGYGDWKMSDELMLRIGRAPYQISDGSTIGINNYERYPYVFDGAFLTYNTKSVAVDLWYAFLPKVWSGSEEQAKFTSAAGFSLDVRTLPDMVKLANIFAIYSRNDSDASDADDEQIRVGLGVGGDVSGVDYKVNAMAHGQSFSSFWDEYALDGQLGYSIDKADVRVYVGGHFESAGYDAFYYDRHYRAGLLDVAEWGNGTVYGEAGVSYLPKENLELGLAAYYFQTVASLGALGADAGVNTDNVAEIDLFVKKSYAGGFSLEVFGGMFDVASADSAYWQVAVNASFDF